MEQLRNRCKHPRAELEANDAAAASAAAQTATGEHARPVAAGAAVLAERAACEDMASRPIAEIRRLAETRDDPIALAVLAQITTHGTNGVRPDPQRAIELYRRCVGRVLSAGTNLGMLLRARNARGDVAEARRLFEAGVAHGFPQAQLGLGQCHRFGYGGPVDYEEAARLFRLAAAAGSNQAVQEITMAYYKGRGVAQSLPEAARWCRIGAERGSAASCHSLALFYQQGEGVPFSPRDALSWAKRGAACAPSSHEERSTVSSCLYLCGQLQSDESAGVPQSEAEALRCFRRALELDPSNANAQHGMMILQARMRA